MPKLLSWLRAAVSLRVGSSQINDTTCYLPVGSYQQDDLTSYQLAASW